MGSAPPTETITGVTLDVDAGEYLNVVSASPLIVSVDDIRGLVIRAVKTGTAAITVKVFNSSDQVLKLGTIFVTVLPEEISSASATIEAPAAGATPQNISQVETATANADYTVTSIKWNQALTTAGKFRAGQVYSATVVLTSKNNKSFTSNTTVTGATNITTIGSGVGNKLIYTVSFPSTEALTVTSIAVTSSPTKMIYIEGELLQLNGMVVTETNNDGTTNDVTFTGGTAVGYTASPANGTALTIAGHNNTAVTITYTATNKSATTVNLTVSPIDVTLQDPIIVGADRIVICIFRTINQEDSEIPELDEDDFILIKDFGLQNEQEITGISLGADPLGGTWEYVIFPPSSQTFAPGNYRLAFYRDGYQAQHVDFTIADIEALAIEAINAGSATLQDYTDAAITGVTDQNISDINTAVSTARTAKGSDLDKTRNSVCGRYG
jgi:hypothetical protein